MFLDYLSSMPGALTQGLIWGLMAIGVYITFKILDIADLTVDGSFACGAVTCAVCIESGMHFLPAMLIAFMAGLLCGLVTGVLHAFLGVPVILAGILTQLSLWSINLLISGSRNNISINPRFNDDFSLFFTSGNNYDALWKMALVVAIVIGLLYIFFGTELGASIRATGNNPKMARALGINTKNNVILGLAISNGIVALAGSLYAQYRTAGGIGDGKGAIVIGLCAVVIGASLFSRFCKNFAYRLSTVIFGGIIYYIVWQTVNFLGLDTNYMNLISAVLVALFLGVPYVRRKYWGNVKKNFQNRKLLRGEE